MAAFWHSPISIPNPNQSLCAKMNRFIVQNRKEKEKKNSKKIKKRLDKRVFHVYNSTAFRGMV